MMKKLKLDEDALLNLKAEIEAAKTTVSELTGQKNALMTQLKETYGCKTIDEAEKKLEKMDKNIKSIEKQIEEGTKALELKLNPPQEEE
jgi:hypothetical protein